MGSCKKDDYTKLTQNSPTKLKYADAHYTLDSLKNNDVLSGLPKENDTLELNYYSYNLEMIYRLKKDLISGDLDTFTVDVGDTRPGKGNYEIDSESGNITIKENIIDIEDEYYAFVNVVSSVGETAFPQAWMFKVGDKIEVIEDLVYKPATMDTLKSGIVEDILSPSPSLYGDFELGDNPFSIASVKLDGSEITGHPFKIDPATAVISVTADDAKKLAYGKYSFSVAVAGDKTYDNVWSLTISVDSGKLTYKPSSISIMKSDITADIVSEIPVYAEGEYSAITNPYSIVSVTKDDKVIADNPFTIDAATGVISILKDKALALDAATYAVNVGVATDDGIEEYEGAWKLQLADAPIVASLKYDPNSKTLDDGTTTKVYGSELPTSEGFTPAVPGVGEKVWKITKIMHEATEFTDENGVFFIQNSTNSGDASKAGQLKARIDSSKDRALTSGTYTISIKVEDENGDLHSFDDVYTFIVPTP